MSYDLMIIGAGPGGYVAAIKAAQLGMKVALIERARVGGTCLNRGCIPTKALLHATDTLREMKSAAENGIQVAAIQSNIEQIYEKKNKVVDQLAKGIEGLVKANKIELIQGRAQVMSPTEIDVSGTRYETKKIMIATGSVPVIPPIPGSDLPGVITSDDLLAQALLYKDLVIIGGGVIGVEFATIFNELGCKVTIIEAAATLLPNLDSEIGKKLAIVFKKQGIQVFTKSTVAAISKDEQLTCTFTSKGKEEIITGEAILIATGRKANVEQVVANNLSLETDRQGICVNPNFETSIPGIYAVGDVANRGTQLAHLASAQGVNAVLAMNDQPPVYQLDNIPMCVYTTPEIASVGLTEEEAKNQGLSVKVGKYNMAGNGKTMIAGSIQGFVKVIAAADSEKILGAQFMCERATDMISELTTAINNGLTIQNVTSVVHPHPTYNEAIGEAYESLLGHAIHIMPKK